jgi:hypothetical protein
MHSQQWAAEIVPPDWFSLIKVTFRLCALTPLAMAGSLDYTRYPDDDSSGSADDPARHSV